MALFQVSIPGVERSTDELGVWQAGPALPDAAVLDPKSGNADAPAGLEELAFFTSAAEGKPEHTLASIWRVELSDDPEEARLAFAAQATRLERSELALPDAARRMKAFVQQSLAEGSESFSGGTAGSALRATPAEQELAGWVSSVGLEASFGLFDNFPKDWKEVSRGAADFFERVRRSVLHFAWVESSSAGRRLGLTTVSWTGHIQTAWGAGLEKAQAGQHMDSLDLALRTRAAWLRMSLLVVRSGVQLGVLFPTNPLLAVPAAWKFFKQILELSQELNQT